MVRELSQHLNSCSVNTATLGFQAPIGDVIEAVASAGFGVIAPWRREIEGHGVNGNSAEFSNQAWHQWRDGVCGNRC